METSLTLLMRLHNNPNDKAGWQRFDDLYRPLIHRWLVRDPGLRDEAEDIVQEVMKFLVRNCLGFSGSGLGRSATGCARSPCRRVQEYLRQRARHPRGQGGPLEESPLLQLSDPGSDLSRAWDEEHNRHVLSRLLELIKPQFEDRSVTAFRRLVFDGVPPAQVAAELGSTVGAVLAAKSRILNRLRQEAEEFLD